MISISKITIISLSIICIIQTIKLSKRDKEFKKINLVLNQIIKGNLNQRIRVRTSNKEIQEVCKRANDLIDKFQNIYKENKIMIQSRKKMISNISHDLRTPLTSLLGYIEAVQNDNSLTEEERENYFKIVESKANTLHVLLEEFFQLSKLEADDVVIKLEKINISEILRETALSYYQDFVNLNITPNVKIPDEDLYVLGDKESIVRIINNLLSNALKYGKDGQDIGIEVREDIKCIWINIWDKGKGIYQENIPFIFDRLYKEERSRNNNVGGTGLGLTIVKRLVQKQNGEIKVNSIPYEKTTFSFSIPKYIERV